MSETITYAEARPGIGRGTRGGTFKDLKAGLDRYLKRKGLARTWSVGPRKMAHRKSPIPKKP